MAVRVHSVSPSWELSQLLDIFPLPIRQALVRLNNIEEIIEVVLDLGRPPEARFEHDFRISPNTGKSRRHRARLLSHLAIRRRQSRGHRADAASHQRDSQPHGENRRPHLPRRTRRVRNDRHHSRRDAQRKVDLPSRASGRRQDYDAARVRARAFRRAQARRDRRYVERNRRRQRHSASGNRSRAAHAGRRSRAAARGDDRSGRKPHAASDRHRRDRHRSRGDRRAHDRRARRAADRDRARPDARKPLDESDALGSGRRRRRRHAF